MSVRLYGLEDLGRIARFCRDEHGGNGPMMTALANISEANVEAFRVRYEGRYEEDLVGLPAKAEALDFLSHTLPPLTDDEVTTMIGDVGLLRYNCDEAEPGPDVLEDLLLVSNHVLFALLDRRRVVTP